MTRIRTNEEPDRVGREGAYRGEAATKRWEGRTAGPSALRIAAAHAPAKNPALRRCRGASAKRRTPSSGFCASQKRIYIPRSHHPRLSDVEALLRSAAGPPGFCASQKRIYILWGQGSISSMLDVGRW